MAGNEYPWAVDASAAGLFVGVALLLMVLAKGLTGRVGGVFTPLVMLAAGAVWRAILVGWDMGAVGASLLAWMNMPPRYVLFLFIPGLIFGGAFNSDFHVLKQQLWSCSLLSGPVLLFVAVAQAVVAALYYSWDWAAALCLGFLLATTDPVAVRALVARSATPVRVAQVMQGEAIINDGTAFIGLVVFQMSFPGYTMTAGHVIWWYFRLAFFALVWGAIMGKVTEWTLSRIQFDLTSEVIVTAGFAWMTFLVAETVPFEISVSGILAVVCMGLLLSDSTGRSAVFSMEKLTDVWRTIEQVCNLFIFLLAGAMLVDRGVAWSALPILDGWDVLFVFVLYCFMNLIRFIFVYAALPALARMEYGLSAREAGVIVFGGVRGAVALAGAILTLGLEFIPETVRYRILFAACCLVVLTVLVNGILFRPVTKALRVADQGEHSILFRQSVVHLWDQLDHKATALYHSSFAQYVNWMVINAHLQDLFHKLQLTAEEATLDVCTKEVRRAGLQPQGSFTDAAPAPLKREPSSAAADFLNTAVAEASPKHVAVSMVHIMRTPLQAPPLQLAVHTPRPFHLTRHNSSGSLMSGDGPVAEPTTPDAQASFFPATGHQNQAPQHFAARVSGASVMSSIRMPDELFAQVQNARMRFLSVVKSQFWDLHADELIDTASLSVLLDACRRAQDGRSKVLFQWDVLERHMPQPGLFLWRALGKMLPHLRSGYWSQPLLRRMLFGTVCTQYGIVTGFIVAHNRAMELFRENEIATASQAVLREAQRQVDAAMCFRSNLVQSFAEIIEPMETELILRLLLRNAFSVVDVLYKNGQVNEVEQAVMLDTVQEAITRMNVPFGVPQTVANMLSRYGILNALSADDRARVLQVATPKHFAAGEYIFEQGSRSSGFYLITSGVVAMLHSRAPATGPATPRVDGEEESPLPASLWPGFREHAPAGSGQSFEMLHRLDAGHVIGVPAMLSGQPNFFSARCTCPVSCLFFSQEDVYELLKSEIVPGLGVLQTSPFEENLCRGAALSVVLLLDDFRRLKLHSVKHMLDRAEYYRPVPLQPFLAQWHILLLTGAVVEYIGGANDSRDTLAAERQRMRSATPSQPSSGAAAGAAAGGRQGGGSHLKPVRGFDPEYHNTRTAEWIAGLGEKSNEYRVVLRSFAFIRVDPTRPLIFTVDSRLLLINPADFDAAEAVADMDLRTYALGSHTPAGSRIGHSMTEEPEDVRPRLQRSKSPIMASLSIPKPDAPRRTRAVSASALDTLRDADEKQAQV